MQAITFHNQNVKQQLSIQVIWIGKIKYSWVPLYIEIELNCIWHFYSNNAKKLDKKFLLV